MCRWAASVGERRVTRREVVAEQILCGFDELRGNTSSKLCRAQRPEFTQPNPPCKLLHRKKVSETCYPPTHNQSLNERHFLKHQLSSTSAALSTIRDGSTAVVGFLVAHVGWFFHVRCTNQRAHTTHGQILRHAAAQALYGYPGARWGCQGLFCARHFVVDAMCARAGRCPAAAVLGEAVILVHYRPRARQWCVRGCVLVQTVTVSVCRRGEGTDGRCTC